MKFQVLLIFTIANMMPYMISSEFYTAISELQKLLRTGEAIINTLETYLLVEENRLEKIKLLTEQYVKLKEESVDEESFLSNPVNAYLLVKRLTKDWEITNYFIQSNDGKNIINNIKTQMLFPSNEDLSGAATALIRLQQMYQLDAKSLANGQIKGAKQTTQLSAGDCYDLGLKAYDSKLYNHSVQWMRESLNRDAEEDVKTAKRVDILEQLANSYSVLQNYTAALSLTEEIVSLDPYHPRAPYALDYLRVLAEYHTANPNENAHENAPETIEMPSESELEELPLNILHPYVFPAYEKLCRGESVKTRKEESRLKCFYTTNDNSYLLLQPIKVEELNLNPRIVMFYDVISDKEADIVKIISMPMLARATVNSESEGKTIEASYRISKSTWIADHFHPSIRRISRRIEDIVRLSSISSEDLHVINYGIGGHYEPHYDFLSEKTSFDLQDRGNRLATWIFYLTDVAAGGSTVFPFIGVEVKPVKGAAAFWYNLYRNGKGNKRTMHAACPVLTGSKWVANKWIHEEGNEFNRRCALNPKE